jgi:SAM-dependent methyltransferase
MNRISDKKIEDGENIEFGSHYARWQIDRKSNYFRRAVKKLYINNVLKYVRGPTIDIGCGAGQILERLPENSLGLEVNSALVSELKRCGLNVAQAKAIPGNIDLTAATLKIYNTAILSHVLEHFHDADSVLRNLLRSARELNIKEIIIVVPGKSGYASDVTHKTFVNWKYFLKNSLINCEGYSIVHRSYFPGNYEWIGKIFAYHEMLIIYTKIEQG